MTTETVAELKARIKRESEAAISLLHEYKIIGDHGLWRPYYPKPSNQAPRAISINPSKTERFR